MHTPLHVYAENHNLTIRDAIRHAARVDLFIGKHADPTEPRRLDLDISEAFAVAAVDSSLLFIVI